MSTMTSETRANAPRYQVYLAPMGAGVYRVEDDGSLTVVRKGYKSWAAAWSVCKKLNAEEE